MPTNHNKSSLRTAPVQQLWGPQYKNSCRWQLQDTYLWPERNKNDHVQRNQFPNEDCQMDDSSKQIQKMGMTWQFNRNRNLKIKSEQHSGELDLETNGPSFCAGNQRNGLHRRKVLQTTIQLAFNSQTAFPWAFTRTAAWTSTIIHESSTSLSARTKISMCSSSSTISTTPQVNVCWHLCTVRRRSWRLDIRNESSIDWPKFLVSKKWEKLVFRSVDIYSSCKVSRI